MLARGPTECDIYNSLAETSVRVRSAPAGITLLLFYYSLLLILSAPANVSPNFSIQSFSSHAISWKIHFSGAKIVKIYMGAKGSLCWPGVNITPASGGRRDSSHSARN